MSKLDNVNYLEIFKKAWKITWENKYLWWFGLFLFLGGGCSFNFLGNFNEGEKKNEIPASVANFFVDHWVVVLIVIATIIFLIVVFVFLGIIAKAGIFKILYKIEKKEKGSFKNGFKEGRKYFWKLLGINLILGSFVFLLTFVLFVPVALLFYLKSVVFGIFAAFLAIFIFIPLLVLVCFLEKYANFYLVLSDLGIKYSLENGYHLFRKNIFPSIIMALFFIPINIVLFFAIILSIISVGIIFLIIGFVLYAIFSNIGLIVTVVFGLLILLTLIVFSGSIYQVFCQTSWFLFFKEIASVKEDKIEETVVENKIIEKSLPTPEEA